ncbi:hypothetical protein GmHk_05G013297 [Glycine max]|nr:hypothetical protein GmHk_05G013297 [Glycine max]
MRLLLLLITSLRRDDIYVENDMEMERGLSPGREHLWAPRLITYGRGAVTCTPGWSRQTQHSSLSESAVWTRLGYFLRFGCCWYVPHCI